MSRRPSAPRRGSVVLVVLWAVAVTALTVSAIQLFSFRQSVVAQEVRGRIEARWAARAGVEYSLAVLQDHTLNPEPDDAKIMYLDLEAVASSDLGRLAGRDGNAPSASYVISHHVGAFRRAGPRDEHSKLNINASGAIGALENVFDDISIDVIAGIADWVDDDDEPNGLGAERDWYLGQDPPYEPRNGPIQSTAELELVGGVWPALLRGEDWNLNGKLDPNEDDGEASWPDDDADGRLDAGWAGLLTAYTNRGGYGDSGLPRVELWQTDVEELLDRVPSLLEEQATFLIQTYGQPNGNLLQLLTYNATQASQQAGGVRFTPEQMRAVFAECTSDRPSRRAPGRVNVNTAPADLVRRLLPDLPAVADELIYMRDNRRGGITSIMDFADIADVETTPDVHVRLAELFTTRSNVFTIASRGRSWGTGVEVEIIAVVDRSKLPVRIIEYREQ